MYVKVRAVPATQWTGDKNDDDIDDNKHDGVQTLISIEVVSIALNWDQTRLFDKLYTVN